MPQDMQNKKGSKTKNFLNFIIFLIPYYFSSVLAILIIINPIQMAATTTIKQIRIAAVISDKKYVSTNSTKFI